MADISKIKVPDGNIYSIKDTSALATLSISNNVITGTTRGGKTVSVTVTDNKTLQEVTTTSSYRPLVAANKSASAVPTDTGAVTNEVYFANKAFIQPSTGNIYSQGSIGVGKTSLTTGCNMVYDSTEECVKFTF